MSSLISSHNRFVSFIIGGVLVTLLGILIGQGITMIPYSALIMVIIAIGIFFISFFHADVALIFLIVSMLLSPEIGAGAVPGRDVTIRVEDFLLFALILAWLAKSAIHQRMDFIPRTPLNRWIFFYALIFVVSTARAMITVNMEPLRAIFYIMKYLEYFVLYFIVAGIVQSKRQLKIFLYAFFVTFALVNLYAYSQIGQVDRISAPFEGKQGEPNTLGGYIVLIVSVLLGLILHIRPVSWKIFLSLLGIFSLWPLMHTQSRSSYLALMVMLFSMIVLIPRYRHIVAGLCVCLVVVASLMTPERIITRVQDAFIPQPQQAVDPVEILGVTLGPSPSARVRSWVDVYEAWQHSPFLGYGVNAYGFLDSQFVRTLVDFGAIGFVSFCLLLGSIFKNTLKVYHSTQDPVGKGLSCGFLAGHVAMIAHALTANTFVIIRIMEPYWFLAALVMMWPKIESNENIKLNTQTIEKV